jgi:hypothetical protein
MAARGNAAAIAEVAEHDAKVADVSSQNDHELKYGVTFYGYGYDDEHDGYDRADPDLVAAVETLGAKANGSCAKLKVVEIPDGTDYEISEYDGNEHIAERHRTWG